MSDADFEERRRVAAEAAGLVRDGTTEDGRATYAAPPVMRFESYDPNWLNRPAPVSSGEAGTGEGLLANVEVRRCDSCNAVELVLRYSPQHGATFCLPCFERENPDPAPVVAPSDEGGQ